MRRITVALEGADKRGKSTQSTLLAEAINAKLVKYPYYDSLTGRIILEILEERYQLESGHGNRAAIIQSLMTINRYETLDLIPKDCNVVFDRYSLSAFVYGGLDGLNEDFIYKINSALPQPDITIIIAGEPVGALNNDFYEKDEKQRAINSLYIKLAKRLYLPIINANQPIDKVHSEIMDIVNKWISRNIVDKPKFPIKV